MGKHVFAHVGWRTHAVVHPDGEYIQKPYILPDFKGLSHSLGLGLAGMPGNTAYFGFLEICKPKAGEILVVSSAAGAVGQLVGQIGKLHGMTVVGIAGSDEKCAKLRSIGFDYAINYKSQDIAEELKKVCPTGIDCYFDNVGGVQTAIVISQMRDFGRISVCGAISQYNGEPAQVPIVQPAVVFKQLTIEGFMVFRWMPQWLDGINQMLQWVRDGKIKVDETISHGFETMPKAFIDMLSGSNTGKVVIKV